MIKFELIKRVFQNIGALPFGKAEISTKNFISDSFKTTNENNDVEEHLIYDAELYTSEQNKIQLALTNMSDELYLIAIIGNNTYGLFIGEDNSNALIFTENKWLSLSILQILNVLIVFETLTQYGLLWNKLGADSVAAINKILTDFIASDSV